MLQENADSLRSHPSDKAKSINWKPAERNREILMLSNAECGPKAAHPPLVFY